MSDFLSSQGRCGTMGRFFSLVACLAWASVSAAASAEPQAPRGKLTPVQRMAPLRLKAAHEDVQRIQRTRRGMPKPAGLNDYRAILHAHAEDSSHTGGTRPEICHHNMVMLVKMASSEKVKVGTIVDRDEEMQSISATLRPGIRELTRGHQPGDILARVDLDPYHRSFRNVCTHILAPELTERAIREALRDGHAYACHDWMCDPTGFAFELIPVAGAASGSSPVGRAIMGDEVKPEQGARLLARFPVSCHVRLLKSGQVIAERRGESLEHAVTAPGVYRVEAWLDVGGEQRGWVYSNPIYVR